MHHVRLVRDMTDRQIEMHWYCGVPSCQHDNRGRDLTCANCGKPRENEEYLMPSDTGNAPSVTDAKLLRQAQAGANWSCHYCRRSQRRLDGNCARCGAPAADAIPATDNAERSAMEFEQKAEQLLSKRAALAAKVRSHKKLGLIAVGVMAATLLLWWLFIPHEAHVTVSAVSWKHSVEIERYRVTSESGWYAASDAFDVRNEGRRFHHYDHRVIGSHIEHYTARVACGEACEERPKLCHDVCTSNKNGYATCRESCTGGGKTCITKYCSEPRTRSVTDYQDFPIDQTWYSWKAWRWLHQRDVVLSGVTTETRWPSAAEKKIGDGLVGQEQEREGASHAEYLVTYTNDKGHWEVKPRTEAEFRRRELNSRWHIKVSRIGIVSEELPH